METFEPQVNPPKLESSHSRSHWPLYHKKLNEQSSGRLLLIYSLKWDINFTHTNVQQQLKRNIFILWLCRLTDRLDILTWPRQGHSEQGWQMFRSQVISVKIIVHTCTPKNCCNGPLKWSIAKEMANNRENGINTKQWARCVYRHICVCVCKSCAWIKQANKHPFNSLFYRTTWVIKYQKLKPLWILMSQEMAGIWDGSGIGRTTWKQRAHRSKQIIMPTLHHSYFTDWMLFPVPNKQCHSN